ncbi:MAG: gamma carbonic anhydrase family protein [Chloroflexi bacterium]|nr:gamma carbonic anhydrase family protein [Chloroflexota bacterium]MDA1298022.1 gamma carbonic anhydrase family protein [Chloroflexota bacterium]
MTIRSLDGKTPQIDPAAFVSEAAYIVGDVVIGPNSSVWPGAVIRADSGRITIGAGSNVQDNSVLHADADAVIGDGVTIGHGVVCHARAIADGCLIGNGAVLNDGVELGEGCLVAAGTTVTENTVFPPRSLVRGIPGKAIGTIRERHAELQRRAAESYVRRIARYRAEGNLESR